eukprot:1229494-Prymnesium_polylepis.3
MYTAGHQKKSTRAKHATPETRRLSHRRCRGCAVRAERAECALRSRTRTGASVGTLRFTCPVSATVPVLRITPHHNHSPGPTCDGKTFARHVTAFHPATDADRRPTRHSHTPTPHGAVM